MFVILTEIVRMFFFDDVLFQHVPPAFYTDPNEIAQHLPLKLTECEKLSFPERETLRETESSQ